jgi:hypothetical protein
MSSLKVYNKTMVFEVMYWRFVIHTWYDTSHYVIGVVAYEHVHDDRVKYEDN